MVYPCHDCIYSTVIRTPNITENIDGLWNETEVCVILQTELHDDILCSFRCPNYTEGD